MNPQLIQSIQQTLAYFDQFDYPLTREELYQWLWHPPTDRFAYTTFVAVLEQIEGIEQKDGFVFLSGREVLVRARQNRVKFIEQKLQIAKRGAAKLQWIPFVKGVFVCNTVALGTGTEESDIDLFIVVRHNRLWFARFLVTITLTLFRLRRHGHNVCNRLCLSFYVTDDHLDISDVAIDDADIYLVYWLATLLPIYDPDHIIDEVYAANQWAINHVPYGFKPVRTSPWLQPKKARVQSVVKSVLEWIFQGRIGDIKEASARWVQVRRMQFTKGSIRDLPDTRVVITDSMLKFHENDRRAQFKKQWERTVNSNE